MLQPGNSVGILRLDMDGEEFAHYTSHKEPNAPSCIEEPENTAREGIKQGTADEIKLKRDRSRNDGCKESSRDGRKLKVILNNVRLIIPAYSHSFWFSFSFF
jgi:hypothetical protein